MNIDIEAVPCTFCASTDISDGEVLTAYPNGKQTKQSMCNTCKALGPEATLDDSEVDYGDVKAIAAWSTRAALTSPQHTEELSATVKELLTIIENIDDQLCGESFFIKAENTLGKIKTIAPQQEPTIPLAGWKFVPMEPTNAMTSVGQKHRYESTWSIGAIYREMLAAAPASPVLTDEDVLTLIMPHISELESLMAITDDFALLVDRAELIAIGRALLAKVSP